MPVIIVNNSFDGAILPFIQSIAFECVILIDEAEKIFNNNNNDDSNVLLGLIDGVYNSARKLYILTTNTLSINENLLGRPGRIRYIQEFRNLPIPAVVEYAKDNLKDINKLDRVLQEVDLLEISTIDILKSIVEEINIFGELSENVTLNIPKAKYVYDVVRFTGCTGKEKEKVERVIACTKKADDSLYDWYHSSIAFSDMPEDFRKELEQWDLSDCIIKVKKKSKNTTPTKVDAVDNRVVGKSRPGIDLAELKKAVKTGFGGVISNGGAPALPAPEETEDDQVELGMSVSDILTKYISECTWNSTYKMTSNYSTLWKDCETSLGNIVETPNALGLFTINNNYDNSDELYLILRQRNNPSLYRGGLVF